MTKHFSDEYILDCRITTNKPTYLKNKVELVFEEYAIENGKKSCFRVIHNGRIIKRFNRKNISPEILETFIKIVESL